MSPREMKTTRRDMQIIFQDPYASLDPRPDRRVDHGRVTHSQDWHAQRARGHYVADSWAWKVTIHVAISHEFSGGQRQRIGIAALALRPALYHLR